MSKFVCENKNCKDYGVIKFYSKESYSIVNNKYISSNQKCPQCGKMRKEILNNTPLSKKNISMAKYTSASPEIRKEILKKRSHDHFNKHVKHAKEDKLRETVKNFKNLGT